MSHKISIYLRAPLNPGKVRVFCALVPSLVVEAWILVGYVWNLVGEVQSLVALQTVWSSIGYRYFGVQHYCPRSGVKVW